MQQPVPITRRNGSGECGRAIGLESNLLEGPADKDTMFAVHLQVLSHQQVLADRTRLGWTADTHLRSWSTPASSLTSVSYAAACLRTLEAVPSHPPWSSLTPVQCVDADGALASACWGFPAPVMADNLACVPPSMSPRSLRHTMTDIRRLLSR